MGSQPHCCCHDAAAPQVAAGRAAAVADARLAPAAEAAGIPVARCGRAACMAVVERLTPLQRHRAGCGGRTTTAASSATAVRSTAATDGAAVGAMSVPACANMHARAAHCLAVTESASPLAQLKWRCHTAAASNSSNGGTAGRQVLRTACW